MDLKPPKVKNPAAVELAEAKPSQPSSSAPVYAGQHKDPNAMYNALNRQLAVPNRAGTKQQF